MHRAPGARGGGWRVGGPHAEGRRWNRPRTADGSARGCARHRRRHGMVMEPARLHPCLHAVKVVALLPSCALLHGLPVTRQSSWCRSVQPQIRDVLLMITGGSPEWSVTTTGHSLGGALATICAYDLATSKCAPSPLPTRLDLQRAGRQHCACEARDGWPSPPTCCSWSIMLTNLLKCTCRCFPSTFTCKHEHTHCPLVRGRHARVDLGKRLHVMTACLYRLPQGQKRCP